MQIRTNVPGRGETLYPLAGSARRVAAAFLDGACDVALGAACWGFCALGALPYGATAAVAAACLAAVMFAHHALLPYFTNGSTLFRLAFRLKLICVRDRRSYLPRLLLHDVGVWIHFACVSLALAITAAAAYPPARQEAFLALLAGAGTPAAGAEEAIVAAFQALYAACGLFSAVFFVHGMAAGGRAWLADAMSGTLMIRADLGVAKKPEQAKAARGGDRAWTLPGATAGN